jgi:hypothetical protein
MIKEMTASALVYYGLAGAGTPGTSDSARHIADGMETTRRHLQESISLGLRGKGVYDELLSVAEECKVENWDGQGAAPVTEQTYCLAYRLLEALPLGTPPPSIGAEPDGHITLEWHRSARRTLSVSVSPEGDLHYSALLGSSKSYGTEPFLGDVPRIILELVSRVIPI